MESQAANRRVVDDNTKIIVSRDFAFILDSGWIL